MIWEDESVDRAAMKAFDLWKYDASKFPDGAK